MALQQINYDPALRAGASSDITANQTISSASNQALAIGLGGATGSAFNVDCSTALQADGINIKGLDAGNGAYISVITTGTNSPLRIDAAGSGTIAIGTTSTGAITLVRATTCSSTLTSTGNFAVGANKLTTAAATGATVIAGVATGTASLTQTAGDHVITSGDLIVTAGKITLTANASSIVCTGTGANGMILKNLKNAAASNLSGTQLDIAIDIGGTPYYFTVYPTKA